MIEWCIFAWAKQGTLILFMNRSRQIKNERKEGREREKERKKERVRERESVCVCV